MNSKDLTIFMTAARLGSINQTGEELNYAQSNITSRIKKLESELEASLFVRHQRGITLTEKGHTLLPYAQKVIALIEEMKTAVQAGDEPAGKLTIASVETVIQLPDILSRFIEAYPLVDFTLTTGVTRELTEMVEQYKMDGAFVTKSARTEHPDLEEIDVFKENLVLITAQHIDELDKVMELPLLRFSDGCGYRAKLDEWLNDKNIRPKKVMELGTLETTIGSVIAGLGAAYVPYAAIEAYEKQGLIRCYKLPAKYSHITTVFIYRKQDHITPALKAFIQIISEQKEDRIDL